MHYNMLLILMAFPLSFAENFKICSKHPNAELRLGAFKYDFGAGPTSQPVQRIHRIRSTERGAQPRNTHPRGQDPVVQN